MGIFIFLCKSERDSSLTNPPKARSSGSVVNIAPDLAGEADGASGQAHAT